MGRQADAHTSYATSASQTISHPLHQDRKRQPKMDENTATDNKRCSRKMAANLHNEADLINTAAHRRPPNPWPLYLDTNLFQNPSCLSRFQHPPHLLLQNTVTGFSLLQLSIKLPWSTESEDRRANCLRCYIIKSADFKRMFSDRQRKKKKTEI